MHLILCVDERDGMSFCGRRLSSDRVLTEHILRTVAGGKLWMNAYSANLFADGDICVDEAFLQKAGEGEYCFAEITPLQTDLHLESVILYHWNRRYPSTVKFPRTLLSGMHLEYTEDFPGNSHEKITMQRYTL